MNSIQKEAIKGLSLLEQAYPKYYTLLTYKNPFELLIAVILSAQTTDNQVNSVTPKLFEAFPTPQLLAHAPQKEVESLVFATGFYKTKAKNIINAAKKLVENYDGIVPNSMEELLQLSGVGRKTAGVVLFHVYNIPAIIVDTHFGRVCRRLGWAQELDPTKLESEIKNILPKEKWGIASMVVNFHGREICKSRAPLCSQCTLYELCPNRDKASHIK